MKMHISSPALVFEEKSGEKKGSYYASKCSKLSRNVCNLIHSKDQLQRITSLESQMHTPCYAMTSVHGPIKWLNDLKSLSLKSRKSACIDAKIILRFALSNRNLLQCINVQGLISPRSSLSRERIRWRQNISLTGRPTPPSLCNRLLNRRVQQQKNDTPPPRSGCEVSQVCAWPLPPAGQLSAFPRSWVLLRAEVCPPCTWLV